MLLSERPRIRFCRACGAAMHYRFPDGDNRERASCDACGLVDYENPINVVGTVPYWEDQVLLCKRAIEPRHGMWTLPAGFLELGESSSAGALRETDEEAGAHVDLGPLFSLLNVVRVGQVHMYYLAALRDLEFNPGPESLEVRLFREQEVPWQQIAFGTVRRTLELYFEDRRRGAFGVHSGDVG